jgi:hypothetical protein
MYCPSCTRTPLSIVRKIAYFKKDGESQNPELDGGVHRSAGVWHLEISPVGMCVVCFKTKKGAFDQAYDESPSFYLFSPSSIEFYSISSSRSSLCKM